MAQILGLAGGGATSCARVIVGDPAPGGSQPAPGTTPRGARFALAAPAVLVFYGVEFVPDLHETLSVLVQRLAIATMVVVALSAGAFLTAVNQVYSRDPENWHRPIKGYLQVLKIVLYAVAALLVVANLTDESPWIFLSGLGAMAAVLLLIFRDTILGLVASLQLTGNDMIHVGDWIEMPQYGADGYIRGYLRNHPKIHQGMTLLVRQLNPSGEGLPIEVYAFTNDTAWAAYEDIQADIFDHILAIAPEFGLRPYQSPSGNDLARLGKPE